MIQENRINRKIKYIMINKALLTNRFENMIEIGI